MTTRRIGMCLIASLTLLMSAAVSAQAQQDNAAGSECLKGTVVKVTDTTIILKAAVIPGETTAKQDSKVLIDKDTSYFDGARKVNRAALQPGNLVLVFCKPAGKERMAKLVRIIGGKKL